MYTVMMKVQSHLMAPQYMSKRRKVPRKLLPLSPRPKRSRYYKRKQGLKVASTQESLTNRK
jgi:hypothetical protein